MAIDVFIVTARWRYSNLGRAMVAPQTFLRRGPIRPDRWGRRIEFYAQLCLWEYAYRY
jgi:hypothetical protein